MCAHVCVCVRVCVYVKIYLKYCKYKWRYSIIHKQTFTYMYLSIANGDVTNGW